MIATAPAARIDAIDQAQIRARAFAALRLLLDRISQSTPLVAFIDDLQWGDQDSARALFEILRPPAAPRMLFIGTFRSDEADESPFLREWHELQRVNATEMDQRDVSVGPLSLEQSTEVVINLLGSDSGSIRRRAVQFHAQTGGNPYLLTELAGCFDPASNSFHATDIHGVLAQKLAGLPADAHPILASVSVSGQALDAGEAVAAAGVASSSENLLIAMRKARLLRVVGNKVDTYHDRIRYAVVDKLDSAARQDMHARLANVIEETDGGLSDAELEMLTSSGERAETKPIARVFDLAYHWDAAKNQQRALAYGLAAAAQARDQFALDVAAEQYGLADRNSGNAPPPVQFQLARGQGEVLLLNGQFKSAEEKLDQALPLADSSYDTAAIIGLKGLLARKMGMITKSVEHLEDAVERLGVSVPRSLFGLGVALTKQISIQAMHTIFSRKLHQQRPDRESELCNTLLGQMEWSYFMFNIPHLLWASFVGLNRAERVPPSNSLVLQYIVHANDMAVIGWFSRAERYYDRARDLSGRLNDQWGAATASAHRALGSIIAARYDYGIEHARQGVEQLSRVGDIGEKHTAQYFLALLLYRMGDLSEAARESFELLQSCVRHEDNLAGTPALSLYVQSSRGEAPFNLLVDSVRLLPGYLAAEIQMAMAEGCWYGSNGRTAEAVEKYEQAWKLSYQNRYVLQFNLAILSELATALRRHAEAWEEQGHDATAIRKRWQRVTRMAVRLSWFIKTERPHALRELALVSDYRGKPGKALKLAKKSCRIADQHKAQYQYAQSLLVQGRLEKESGVPGADDRLKMAQARIAQIESAVRDTVGSTLST